MTAPRPSRTQLLRQAKSIADELRAALAAGQDPADSSVEFLRQNLRRHYTSFLFASSTPSARANDVVNLMWLECSHALIARHRDRITKLDAEIELNKKLGRDRAPKGIQANPTTRRKLVHTLRAFLTAEEKFFSDLVTRLIDTYHVEAARRAARTLGIAVGPSAPATEAPTSEAGTAALALVQTALIFYGDLARYAVLYREQKEEGAARANRFERAAECYHQARLLVPSIGRPDNQLAVIASASKDSLSAAFHYMRATAVRSGFDTARANLDSTYRQAMSDYRANPPPATTDVADLGATTRKAFVVCLAMLVSDVPKDAQTSAHDYEAQLARTRDLLVRALLERSLPSESIIKIVLLAIGSCWNARLGGGGGGDVDTAKRRNEVKLLELLLEVLTVMFNVSATVTEQALDASLEEQREEDVASTFAPRISAPVRRIAPALRIASIWLLGHLDRIERAANKETFWHAYAAVVNMFVTAFPPELLPCLPSGANLEEDFELLAFLPCPLPHHEAATAFVADHPNHEFLFRVQGFVNDAMLVVAQSPYLQNLNGLLVDRLPSLPTSQDVAIADADDDVINDAMREARLTSDDLFEDDDEDEDDILYVPRPVQLGSAPSSRPGSNAPSPPPPTAGDLLLSVLSGGQEGGAPSIWAPPGGENPWRMGRG